MTIYVGNLSFQAEREDLLDLFGQYGEVRQCSLPLDRETGRKRGFAFVELSDDAAEQKAISRRWRWSYPSSRSSCCTVWARLRQSSP